MKTIEFEGHEFEYDPAMARSYKNIKLMARAKKDPTLFFDVAESVFCGKDEEYASVLNDDFDLFGKLVGAVFDNEGDSAKN